MAFDTLQGKVVEGLLSLQIRSAIDQPAHHQHGVAEREIEKSEMNNLKRHQQPYLTKVTYYSSRNL